MKRRRWLAIVSALLPGVCLWGLAAGETLKGSIVVTGTVPAKKKLDVTIDQYVCGTEKDTGDLVLSPRRELRNAVVWIDNPPSRAAPVNVTKVEMDQKECVFIPRVVIVPANGTVDFLNSDRLLHNIHATPQLNASFNRTQPKARTISVTFSTPEIIRINCDLHSWMVGWVVVATHAYYAITGADGQFQFDDLPPGQYKLKVWHERLGTVEASAAVGEQPARVTIEMKAR
jgi:plastocyanin